MDINKKSEVIDGLDKTAKLLEQWGVSGDNWCLLDGPALKLQLSDFDSSPWRNHLNVYVIESRLPWSTKETELTIPHAGSPHLEELLVLVRRGIDVHLVPASRYFEAGFRRTLFELPSGRAAQLATLSGCSQVWSYKSAEIVDFQSLFEGDIDRIVDERIRRLSAALTADPDAETRERIVLLQEGYEALRRYHEAAASALFSKAAGPIWKRGRVSA